jgi:hypothetical protein
MGDMKIRDVEGDMAWWVFDQVVNHQSLRCRSGEVYELTDGEEGEPFTFRRVSDGVLFEVGFAPEVSVASAGITRRASQAGQKTTLPFAALLGAKSGQED